MTRRFGWRQSAGRTAALVAGSTLVIYCGAALSLAEAVGLRAAFRAGPWIVAAVICLFVTIRITAQITRPDPAPQITRYVPTPSFTGAAGSRRLPAGALNVAAEDTTPALREPDPAIKPTLPD